MCSRILFFFKYNATPRYLLSFPPGPSPNLVHLGATLLRPAREPEAVAAGLVGDDDPVHRHAGRGGATLVALDRRHERIGDRKSTRLNSSHANISYAVFCLKKKKHTIYYTTN